MNLFSNSNDQISKILENFQNERTPFYLIVVVCVFTVSHTIRYNISEAKWWWIYSLIGFVLIMAILLSYAKQIQTDKSYNIQLQWTRSLGIASAILCIFLTGQYALNDQELFLLVFIPCVVQIIVFGLYLFFRDLRPINESIVKSKDATPKLGINYLQICIITTTLLAGIATNSSLSKKAKIESTIADLCLTDDIRGLFNKGSSVDISDKKATITGIKDCYYQLKSMNSSLAMKSDILQVFLNKEAYDKLLEVQYIVSNVSDSPLLGFALECLEENNMLDSLNNLIEDNKSLIDLYTNSSSYSKQFSKLIQGYGQALNTLSEIDATTAALKSCLTPATDTIISSFLQTYEKQEQILSELSSCYKYVDSFDENNPKYMDRRYQIVNYSLLGLWFVCMLYWIFTLFYGDVENHSAL